MTDIIDPKKRSEVMSKIRSKNTKAELLVFSYLRKHNIYFQKHYERAPGKPDIALPRKKRAVFIDGDFWHGGTFEQLVKRRASPDDYWVKKISKNIERDRDQMNMLNNAGWDVMRVWESDIIRKRTRENTFKKIESFLLR